MIFISERHIDRRVRRGTIVAYLAITIVPLVAFLALAIDLGWRHGASAGCSSSGSAGILKP